MNFVFYSGARAFESWDWTNPDTVGIGGSETSHVEMCRRLAQRGHSVTSFAPSRFEGPEIGPAGVPWIRCDRTDFNTEGVWVVYRDPEAVDHLRDDQVKWLVCQDVDYRDLTDERANRFDRIIALCETHGQYLRWKHPKANVVVSSNGIKVEAIQMIAANPPARNPHRMLYASSPDRGLEFLLKIFPRVREIVTDAELHVFYGFDNIDKVIKHYGEDHAVARNARRLQAQLQQPGVNWHGRMGQIELLREWFKTGVWCHPSNFTETSCITCMDAQACGAIPITSPVWAIAENVKHGVFIEGDVRNELIQARYVLEIVRMLLDPQRQEEIRTDMMPWAMDAWTWENFVSQWESWAKIDLRQEAAA